jgi:hypothetical protein
MLMLRYFERTTVIPITVRTVQKKIFEILNFMENRQKFTFTAGEGAKGPILKECLENCAKYFEGYEKIGMKTQGGLYRLATSCDIKVLISAYFSRKLVQLYPS